MLKDQRLTSKGLCSIAAEVKGARSMAMELHTRESLAFPLAGGLNSSFGRDKIQWRLWRPFDSSAFSLVVCCLLFWVHERSK